LPVFEKDLHQIPIEQELNAAGFFLDNLALVSYCLKEHNFVNVFRPGNDEENPLLFKDVEPALSLEGDLKAVRKGDARSRIILEKVIDEVGRSDLD